MNSIVRLIGREPVRVRIYTVVVAVMAFLAYRGWVTGNDIPYLEAILTAILAVPATESARSKVRPEKKMSQPNVARAPGAAHRADEPPTAPTLTSDDATPPPDYQYPLES